MDTRSDGQVPAHVDVSVHVQSETGIQVNSLATADGPFVVIRLGQGPASVGLILSQVTDLDRLGEAITHARLLLDAACREQAPEPVEGLASV
ncbi:MAG: hypothetical protein ACRDQA_22680 [Nocardioidaceae bacterium]